MNDAVTSESKKSKRANLTFSSIVNGQNNLTENEKEKRKRQQGREINQAYEMNLHDLYKMRKYGNRTEKDIDRPCFCLTLLT
jgi:hypothetical protein